MDDPDRICVIADYVKDITKYIVLESFNNVN